MTKTYCDRCGREYKDNDNQIWKYWRDLKPGEIGVEIHLAHAYPGGETAVLPMDLCKDCYNHVLSAVLPLFINEQSS